MKSEPWICLPRRNWPTVAEMDSLLRCSNSFAMLDYDQVDVENFGNRMLWSNLVATRCRMYPTEYQSLLRSFSRPQIGAESIDIDSNIRPGAIANCNSQQADLVREIWKRSRKGFDGVHESRGRWR